MKNAWIAWVVVCLTGCGIQQAAEDTLSQVKESNEKQSQLLDYMEETAKMTEAIKEHNASIDKYNEQMAHGIHLQILGESLDGMFAPENTEVLMPPLAMMPFAETYANEAYPEEISKTLDFLLKRVYMTPSEHLKVRQVSLMALGLIASFMPEDRLSWLVEKHVQVPGLYEEATYVAGVTRFHFIRDFLLTPIYETSDLQNQATLREAVKHFEMLKKVVESPYRERFKLHIPSVGVENWQVEKQELTLIGKRAKRKFIQKLGEGTLQLLETQELLGAFDS